MCNCLLNDGQFKVMFEYFDGDDCGLIDYESFIVGKYLFYLSVYTFIINICAYRCYAYAHICICTYMYICIYIYIYIYI
jgi:hypothetical protein